MIRAGVRFVRSAVLVAAVAGAASLLLQVPLDVALGYCLVGWGARALLRRPLRRMARRSAIGASRRRGRARA